MLRNIALLLPAIIPSWRFFDEIAPSPRIEFALLEDAQHVPQHWQEFRPRPTVISLRGMLRRLFWNPTWNESLFLVSCAERLMQQPTEHSHDEILKRIQADLREQEAGARFLQFRLVFITRQDTALHGEVTYMSPVHAVESVVS